jgi:hypothetical protein
VIICLLEHGADVNIKNNVSTATISLPLMCASSMKTLNSGVAVMVVRDDMVVVVVCDYTM